MRKIPTLFKRDPDDMRYVLPEVTPGCEWVLAGEGVATRKYDGTCVMLDADGRWWARREVKPDNEVPANFWAVETDPATGKTVGWEPIEQSPFARFHAEAVENGPTRGCGLIFPPGSYELCGPKINGNPEGWGGHYLLLHAAAPAFALTAPLTFDSLAADLVVLVERFGGVEGIVWHHPDGRMAKLKAKDFPAEVREIEQDDVENADILASLGALDDCCPHWPDGHRRPGSKPMAAWVGPELDIDGQPMILHVAYTAGHHVSEAEAEWLCALLQFAVREGWQPDRMEPR